jgi:hypothetical protein
MSGYEWLTSNAFMTKTNPLWRFIEKPALVLNWNKNWLQEDV